MVTQPTLWELVSPVVYSDSFASVTLDPSALRCCLLSKRSGIASLYLFACLLGWLFVCLFQSLVLEAGASG